MRAYSQFLRAPGVPRVVAAAVLSRVPASMLTLSLLLGILGIGGSYADAGLVLTMHALFLAVAAPIAGRIADRLGPRIVVIGYLVAHATAYAGLVFAFQQRAALPLLAIAAAAVGTTTPPAGPVTRSHWPVLVEGGRLQTAYAFDSALNSATFVAGPLLASGLMFATSPLISIVATGIVRISGDLLLATSPGLAPATPVDRQRSRRRLGPLGDPTLRLLLFVIALDTFAHGSLGIAAAASTGGQSTTGILTGGLAAGEVIGGLVYGARRWPGSLRAQLVVLHAITAVILLTTGFATLIPLLFIGYLVAGTVSGTRDAVNNLTLSSATSTESRTETFAWLTTFMWAGYGIGTVLAGLIKTQVGTGAVYQLTAAVALIATLLATRLRSIRTAESTTPETTSRESTAQESTPAVEEAAHH